MLASVYTHCSYVHICVHLKSVCVCVKEKIKMKMFENGLVRCHVEHRLYLATVSYLRSGVAALTYMYMHDIIM